MANSTIKAVAEIKTGSNAVTTTHVLSDASVCRIGKLCIVNVAITTNANVTAWTEIAKIKNFEIPVSQYIAGLVDSAAAPNLIYISNGGKIELNTSLASGKDIRFSGAFILS